jgi:hypothetical protein
MGKAEQSKKEGIKKESIKKKGIKKEVDSKKEYRAIPEARQPEKVKIVKVGSKRLPVILLWLLFGFGLVFAIYKNFTAIDTHTVYEREIIDRQVIDTNGIESFVKDFAWNYHAWQKDTLNSRDEVIGWYLRDDLKAYANSMVSKESFDSTVLNVQFWDIRRRSEHIYEVIYTVHSRNILNVDEVTSENFTAATYSVDIYVGITKNMVIVSLPTVSSRPHKSSYIPEKPKEDMSIEAETTRDIAEFLRTVFTIYPNANDKELEYYVKNQAIRPIDGNYTFLEVKEMIVTMDAGRYKVFVVISFIDEASKAVQFSQFNLILEKGENYSIVDTFMYNYEEPAPEVPAAEQPVEQQPVEEQPVEEIQNEENPPEEVAGEEQLPDDEQEEMADEEQLPEDIQAEEQQSIPE